jgi:hypothetical protein
MYFERAGNNPNAVRPFTKPARFPKDRVVARV